MLANTNISKDKNSEGNMMRGFYHYSRSWYAFDRVFVDEIMIGLYDRAGGTNGEFAIRWYQLGDRVVPKLEVFDDAWQVLLQDFAYVLQKMSEVANQDIQPIDFCKLLVECGLTDLTEETQPE